MQNIKIQFSQQKVRAGEQLEGNVVLHVTKPVDFSSITFHIICEEGSHYTAPPTPSHNTTQLIKRKYVRFHHKEILLPSEGCEGFIAYDNVSLLANGHYSFPFSILLPENLLPSLSILSPLTYIKYYAFAKINTLYSFSESSEHLEKQEIPFTVLERHYQTLTNETNNNVVSRTGDKTFLLNAGNLQLFAEIPKLVYYYNERIPLHLNIQNTTKKSIKQINVTLNQYLKLKNIQNKGTKLFKLNQIRKVEYPNSNLLLPHLTLNFDDFTIPNNEYFESNFNNLNTNYNLKMIPSMNAASFSILYNLNVEIVTKGLGANLNINLPLIIKSSPYNQQSIQYQPQACNPLPVYNSPLSYQPLPFVIPPSYQPINAQDNSVNNVNNFSYYYTPVEQPPPYQFVQQPIQYLNNNSYYDINQNNNNVIGNSVYFPQFSTMNLQSNNNVQDPAQYSQYGNSSIGTQPQYLYDNNLIRYPSFDFPQYSSPVNVKH